MKRYLKSFDSHQKCEEYMSSNEYADPSVYVCLQDESENHVHYNDNGNILTFVAEQENSTIKLNRVGTDTALQNAVFKYSTNNGGLYEDYVIGDTITLQNAGDSVKFKGVNDKIGTSEGNFYQFVMTGKIAANGDVTSLINGIGGPIVLPAYSCFAMFMDCTSLTTPPELPSLIIGEASYGYMFQNCTSLTTAPELPATTLGSYCYYSLFENCTMLEYAPSLPSDKVWHRCYEQMFQGCSSLKTVPELKASSLVYGCYTRMFNGCTSLTVAPELPAKTLAGYCYQSMFQNCKLLTTAPILPAITLKDRCYLDMFTGCSNLGYIKAMFTTTPSAGYTGNWVSGVKSTGTFVKNSSATWNVDGVHGIPTGWTVQTESE